MTKHVLYKQNKLQYIQQYTFSLFMSTYTWASVNNTQPLLRCSQLAKIYFYRSVSYNTCVIASVRIKLVTAIIGEFYSDRCDLNLTAENPSVLKCWHQQFSHQPKYDTNSKSICRIDIFNVQFDRFGSVLKVTFLIAETDTFISSNRLRYTMINLQQPLSTYLLQAVINSPFDHYVSACIGCNYIL